MQAKLICSEHTREFVHWAAAQAGTSLKWTGKKDHARGGVGGTLTVIALTLTVIALILSKQLQRIVVVTSLPSSTVLHNGGITILGWWFGAHSCTRQQVQCTRNSMRSLAAHLSGDAFGAWHVVIITAILIQERGWIIVIIDAALFGGHWHRLAERWVHAATGRSQLPLQRNAINQTQSHE
jgi:uncharacterized membrane protein YcfT